MIYLILLIILIITINVVEVVQINVNLNQKKEVIRKYIQENHIQFIDFHFCNDSDVSSITSAWKETGVRFSLNSFDLRFKYFNGQHATISDYECSESLFNKHANQNQLNERNKWLMFTSNFREIVEKLKVTNLRLDSDIIIAEILKVRDQDYVKLYNIYNPGFQKGGSLVITEQDVHRTSFYEERKYLKGVLINSVIVATHKEENQSLHDYMTSSHEKYWDNKNKLNYMLFQALKDYHSFNTSFVQLKHEKSLRNLLMSRRADIGVTAILPTKDVIKTLDLLTSTYPLRARFVLRNVVNYEGRNEYVDPLSRNVWFAMLVTTIIVIVVLKFVFHFDAVLFHNAPPHIKINIDEGKHWSAVLFDIFYILIQQGSTYEPESIAGRSILYAYLLLSVIIYNYYTSIMVSDLLALPPPPYRNLNQLIISKLSLGVQNESLEFSKYQPRNDYDTQNIQNIKSYDLKTGILKVRRENFAYHVLTTEAYALIDETFELNEICVLDKVVIFKDLWMNAVLSKNSQYHEMFTITQRRLLENGILDHAKKHWLVNHLPCFANKDIRPAGFDNCRPAFIIFIVGLFMSIGLLCFEIALYRGFLDRCRIKKSLSVQVIFKIRQ